MTTFHATKGDLKDYIIVDVDGIDTIVGATITGYVRNTLHSVSAATLTGAIETATATASTPCQVRLQLGVATGWLDTVDATTRPRWLLKTRLVFGDGSQLSWPAFGYDEIIVTDDLIT